MTANSMIAGRSDIFGSPMAVSIPLIAFSTLPAVSTPLVRPALDEIAFGDLPEWGDEFSSGACDHGDELHLIARRIGIIETDDELTFDGIDEPAYEEYYDMRSQSEGVVLGIER